MDYKFRGTLKSLMLVVRKRVTRATESIQQFDDPAIIDREMRFLRPFWEFLQTRQKLNRQRFWDARKEDLFVGLNEPIFRKTPLLWLPERGPLCQTLSNPDDRKSAAAITLLRGVEIVLYNFSTLLSRSHRTLGIDDPNSFQLVTQESDGNESYRLLRATLKRKSAETSDLYRIITTRLILPDQEEIKIEKDFSGNPIDPDVQIRITADRSGRQRGPFSLQYRGRQSELNQRSGRIKIVRL